jgi:hypothetical protein
MYNISGVYLDRICLGSEGRLLSEGRLHKNINYHDSNFAESYFSAKHGHPFVLHNAGLFITSRFQYKDVTCKLPVFVIKKKLYSFLRVNEMKMFMFNLKKRQLALRSMSFFNNSKFSDKKYELTNKTVYDYFTFNSKFSLNTNNNYIIEEIFQKSNLHLTYRAADLEESKLLRRDLIIPKIKFKPGYQRLWRNFRRALAESIDFKYVYQQQLTRYLVRFYRRLNHTSFTQNENVVYKVVIYSRLLPDKPLFDSFFNNNFIYVNGKTLLDSSLYVYRNDFIQLEISN